MQLELWRQGLVRALLGAALITLSCLAPIPSNADQQVSRETRQAGLKLIADFADRMCSDVPLSSTSEAVNVQGKLNAELSGLAKRLADLGFGVHANIESTASSGLLQKDLVEALKNKDDCRFRYLKELKGIFLGAEAHNSASKPSTEQVLELLGDFDRSNRARGARLLAQMGADGVLPLTSFLKGYSAGLTEINRYENLSPASYLKSVLTAPGLSPEVRDRAVIDMLRGGAIDNSVLEAWLALRPSDVHVAQALAATSQVPLPDSIVTAQGRCRQHSGSAAFETILLAPGNATYHVIRHTIEVGPPWTLCMLPLLTDVDPDRDSLIYQSVVRQLPAANEHPGFIIAGLIAASQSPKAFASLLPDLIRFYSNQSLMVVSDGDDKLRLRSAILSGTVQVANSLPDLAVPVLENALGKVSSANEAGAVCDFLSTIQKSNMQSVKAMPLFRSLTVDSQFPCFRDLARWSILQYDVSAKDSSFDLQALLDSNSRDLRALSDVGNPRVQASLLYILQHTRDQPLGVEIIQRLRGTASYPDDVVDALAQRLAGLFSSEEQVGQGQRLFVPKTDYDLLESEFAVIRPDVAPSAAREIERHPPLSNRVQLVLIHEIARSGGKSQAVVDELEKLIRDYRLAGTFETIRADEEPLHQQGWGTGQLGHWEDPENNMLDKQARIAKNFESMAWPVNMPALRCAAAVHALRALGVHFERPYDQLGTGHGALCQEAILDYDIN